MEEEIETVITYTATSVSVDYTWLWIAGGVVLLTFAVVGVVVAFVASRRDEDQHPS
jgi:hypothetical protein